MVRSHSSQTALLLTELFAELAHARDLPSAIETVLDWATETLDAEFAIALRDTDVVASRGFGAGLGAREVAPYALGNNRKVPTPFGDAHRASAPVDDESITRLVVMRLGEPLDRHERGMIVGMARTLGQTLRLIRALEHEREAKERLDQANSALVEANQVKDEFVSMASHELRTPLTSILGFTETLQARHESMTEEERRTVLAAMLRQGHRLRSLIDDLLDLSRYSSLAEVERERVNLAQIVESAAAEAGLSHVEAEIDPRAVPMANPEHVHRALSNLLNNARKYGAPPYRVRATLRPEAVVIVVQDAGPGIPTSFVPEMFNRFTQASTGERREASGTGLGLAIVRTLVEQNGGTVAYMPEGHGARFEIRLPRDGEESRATEAPVLSDLRTSAE